MSSNLMPHQSAPIERTLLETSASVGEGPAVTASFVSRYPVVNSRDYAYRQQYAAYRTYNPASRTTCQHGLGGSACWTPIPSTHRRY